jgi:hypothetical protein
MSVTVFDHQHDAPLVLEGVGTLGAVLIIQTGTIVFNFQGVAGEGWIRDRLRHTVLDLPPSSSALLGTTVVRAVASAAPASMNYSPGPVGVSGGQGVFAQGSVLLFGFADPTSGQVNVSGPVSLPVTGAGSVSTAPTAGWAVDRTRARRVQNQIELLVDLAVAGPASLLRFAYSLFVTIAPRLITETDITKHFDEP